jgi:DNA-binding response OmpR family regulator
MISNDQLQAVLVSNDMKTLCLMDRALDPFQFRTEVFAEQHEALEFLEANSTDVVIFDWTKHEESGAFARRLREMARRQVLMCIANSSTAMREALGTGAHFVSHSPESVDQISALVRAASALILYNRRQSFRLDVNLDAAVAGVDRDLGNARIINLSANGLCLEVQRRVLINELLSLSFKLPEGSAINADAKVCWTKDQRVGVEFAALASRDRKTLTDWLENQFAELLVKWNPAWKFTTQRKNDSRPAARA